MHRLLTLLGWPPSTVPGALRLVIDSVELR